MADNNEPLQEMTFWDHLEALRWVLIRIAVTVIIAAVALFAFMPDIFDNVILAPCRGDFPLYKLFEKITDAIPYGPDFNADGFKVNLINIQLASQFFIHISTSCWLAFVLTFPLLLYFLWGFVSPALYPNEKKGVRTAFGFGVIMFFIGVAVGYYVVFPVTLRFLADYHVSEMVPNQISLDSYMDTFIALIFIMGVVFELPLLCWLLGRLCILDRGMFKQYRRHAIVVLLVIAAIITPTGDPFTLSVVFLPIYLLYELSGRLVPAAVPSED